MLATRIKQKDGTFYFVSYKAVDLLAKVRFLSRYYFEGEEIKAEPMADDEIGRFISAIEKSERAFQRRLIRRKVGEIVNFYETAATQPLIPGAVLLFTPEELKFEPLGHYAAMGDLREPKDHFIIIDGQHRLAGLLFFQERHPQDIDQIEVPCMIFDRKSEDFAAEMFVIINSTHTRINKSHLVDLLEKVTFKTSEESKFSAKMVHQFYEATDSPLQYKINKLGGRSRQKKWILQSELYNEVLRLTENNLDFFRKRFDLRAEKAYPLFRDYLKAVQSVMGEIWGHRNFRVTEAVTLKALFRVLGDLVKEKEIVRDWDKGGQQSFETFLAPWKELGRLFRVDGFYERFPAKGPIERTRKIHEEFMKTLGLKKKTGTRGEE